MTKAMRMMNEQMTLVESVVYVLDARAPLSSINHAFDEVIGDRPILFVLNKSDTVPADELTKWQSFFNQGNSRCVTANSTINGGAKKVIAALNELNADTIEKYRKKGVKKTIRAMVIGIPNCGKSTLINCLKGKKQATTGNRPGVTRGKQWIAIDEYLEVLDTPGTLYPDFSDQEKAVHLAIIGSIREQVVDMIDLSNEILKFLKNHYPKELCARYKLSDLPDEKQLLETIAQKRGYVLRGAEIDYDRTAQSVVTDFRKQAFGKIILEKYERSD
ncbi:MAG: ribosome biogenesis GTPase YlqF [Clostridia bacterium]|nr:ribosome biogenesis GTPase YlqF [Clostridia bacterium]